MPDPKKKMSQQEAADLHDRRIRALMDALQAKKQSRAVLNANFAHPGLYPYLKDYNDFMRAEEAAPKTNMQKAAEAEANRNPLGPNMWDPAERVEQRLMPFRQHMADRRAGMTDEEFMEDVNFNRASSQYPVWFRGGTPPTYKDIDAMREMFTRPGDEPSRLPPSTLEENAPDFRPRSAAKRKKK